MTSIGSSGRTPLAIPHRADAAAQVRATGPAGAAPEDVDLCRVLTGWQIARDAGPSGCAGASRQVGAVSRHRSSSDRPAAALPRLPTGRSDPVTVAGGPTGPSLHPVRSRPDRRPIRPDRPRAGRTPSRVGRVGIWNRHIAAPKLPHQSGNSLRPHLTPVPI
jgi:hypothetical protein